jgi:hypothetical protein
MDRLHTKTAKQTIIESATSSPWHLAEYFRQMESDPNSKDTFAGYRGLAESLRHTFENFVPTDDLEDVQFNQLKLKPRPDLAGQNVAEMSEDDQIAALRAAQRERLYEGEGLAGSQALVLLTYKMTEAQPIHDSVDKTGSGDVILHGKLNAKHIYFVEHYGYDDGLGRYMSVALATNMPWELIPDPIETEVEEKPFLTTNQANDMKRDVFETLVELPTAEVDEAKILQDWIHHRRAA